MCQDIGLRGDVIDLGMCGEALVAVTRLVPPHLALPERHRTTARELPNGLGWLRGHWEGEP